MSEGDFQNLAPEIIELLKKKAPNFKCSICDKDKFIVAGGFHRHELQKSLKTFVLPGLSIPAVTLICDYCGKLYDFQLQKLGLELNLEQKFEDLDNGKNKKDQKQV